MRGLKKQKSSSQEKSLETSCRNTVPWYHSNCDKIATSDSNKPYSLTRTNERRLRHKCFRVFSSEVIDVADLKLPIFTNHRLSASLLSHRLRQSFYLIEMYNIIATYKRQHVNLTKAKAQYTLFDGKSAVECIFIGIFLCWLHILRLLFLWHDVVPCC